MDRSCFVKNLQKSKMIRDVTIMVLKPDGYRGE